MILGVDVKVKVAVKIGCSKLPLTDDELLESKCVDVRSLGNSMSIDTVDDDPPV